MEAERESVGPRKLYNVLNKCGEAIVRIKDRKDLCEEISRIIVEDGGFSMAWVGVVDPETKVVKPVAHWGSEEGYLSRIRPSILEIPEGLVPTGTSVREERYDICRDIDNDERFAPYQKEALARGFRSCAAFPLFVSSEPIGALTVYASRQNAFDEEDVDLLESLARDLSFAIESMSKEERSKKAEENLKRSERYFRSLIENALDIIAVLNGDGTIRYATPSVEHVLGYKRSEIRDRNVLDFLDENQVEELRRVQAKLAENPGTIEGVEALFRDSSGSWRTLEAVCRSYIDETGELGLVVNARDVTGRKLMQEELEDSAETQRTLLNALTDSVYLIETDGTLLAVNETGANAIESDVNEAVGENLFDFLGEGFLSEIKPRVSKVISSRLPVRLESSRQGSVSDVSIYPILDVEGQVSRIAILSRDITERKKTEEAQRKDRDFISAVIDTTGALVIVLDSDGRIILFNSTCEQVTGFSSDEVRGRYIWDSLLAAEEIEDVKSSIAMLKSGEAENTFERHLLTKHGGRRLISWSNTVLLEEDGSVGYIIGTGLDVTEQRKAEEALRESEEQYRTIFESTGTAMCIIDEDAMVLFVNQEFERMTGYGVDEIQGLKSFTDFLVDEDADSFRASHHEARRVRRTVPVHFECRIKDKRDNLLYVFANMGIIPARNSSVISLIDITKEKNYEKDLKETAERLRHFLTVASHELRHPITVVKGYANTLTEYMDTMPRDLILEILEDIDSSSDRLTSYVEELMDVSRVEDGQFPIERQSSNAEQLVQMALGDVKITGSERQFRVNVAPDVGDVFVDPGKFVQLLVVLVENAIKFSNVGSTIEIDLVRNEDGVVVSVKDEGVGIEEEHRSRVFDRFYQVEDTLHHSTPGIGLGLYIAREIVQAHGGRIWCEPRQGKGTVFRFFIPSGMQI